MLEVNCAYLLLLQERGPKVPFQSKPQHALLAPHRQAELAKFRQKHGCMNLYVTMLLFHG